MIRTYQCLISPWHKPCCRFYPSCSEYAAIVWKEQSMYTALVLSIKRLLKCHPFHPGGVDMPPCANKFTSN